jgi:hypothetical protein
MTARSYLFFSLILIVFIIYGCCKAECINRTVAISFRNIRAINTDSVSLIAYKTGSNFTQKLDSNFSNIPVPAADTSYSTLFLTVFADRDWKIINHSLNKEYRLNNFEVDKIKCCGERAYVVRSFEINGIRKTGDLFDVE